MEKIVNKQAFPENGGGEKLHLALCVNEAWADHIGPLLYSISKYNPTLLSIIHIVYRDLSEQKQTQLKHVESRLENIELSFHYLDEGMIDMISVDNYYLPLETYFRFMLPEILPEVKRILYLDVDTLVLGDLLPLWEMNLKGFCIGAGVELDGPVRAPEYFQSIGFGEKDGYFNAGVLLLDLDYMRKNKLAQKLINYASEKVDSLEYGDQDILNLYFKGKVAYFDNRYNYTNEAMKQKGLTSDIVIAHYNGPKKPWTGLLSSYSFFRPFIGQYLAHKREYQSLLSDTSLRISVMMTSNRSHVHLKQSLDSLMRQTYPNLEILIADYSLVGADREWIEELKVYDDRIQLVEADSDRPSAIKQELVRLATGDYVTFLDTADYLELSYLECLHHLAIEHQCCIAMVDSYLFDNGRGVFSFPLAGKEKETHYFEKDRLLRDYQTPAIAYLGGKLYQKTLLDTCYAQYGLLLGERNLVRQLYLLGKSCVYLNSMLYCHRMNFSMNLAEENILSYYEDQLDDIRQAYIPLTLLGCDLQALQIEQASIIEELTQQQFLTVHQNHKQFLDLLPYR